MGNDNEIGEALAKDYESICPDDDNNICENQFYNIVIGLGLAGFVVIIITFLILLNG